jgi:hypothetical protein
VRNRFDGFILLGLSPKSIAETPEIKNSTGFMAGGVVAD